MLLDHNAPADAERARRFPGEAIEVYREIGTRKHVGLAKRLLAEA